MENAAGIDREAAADQRRGSLLASGTSTPPLLTVTGTWMESAGPPPSVLPQLTCTLAPAARSVSVLFIWSKPALTFTVGWLAPLTRSRAVEDHAAVVAVALPTFACFGRSPARANQRGTVGGLDVLDAAAAGQVQSRELPAPADSKTAALARPPRRRRSARCRRRARPAPSNCPRGSARRA